MLSPRSTLPTWCSVLTAPTGWFAGRYAHSRSRACLTYSERSSRTEGRTLPTHVQVVVNLRHHLGLLVGGEVWGVSQREHAEEHAAVGSVTVAAVPQPGVVEEVGDAHIGDAQVAVITRVLRQSHHRLSCEAGRVRLVAEAESEVRHGPRSRAGLVEVGAVAGQLVGLDEHKRVQSRHVVLAALARGGLTADDLQRLEVEEDRPPKVEPSGHPHRIRQRTDEQPPGATVAQPRRAGEVEQRVVEVPAVHRAVALLPLGLLQEGLSREPSHERADPRIEEAGDRGEQLAAQPHGPVRPSPVLVQRQQHRELHHALGRLGAVADVGKQISPAVAYLGELGEKLSWRSATSATSGQSW